MRRFKVRIECIIEAESAEIARLRANLAPLGEGIANLGEAAIFAMDAEPVLVAHRRKRDIENAFSETVLREAAKYKITLAPRKHAEPEWRVPDEPLWGEVQGLPAMRGKCVLTNGLMAYLVRPDGRWFVVHYHNFNSDDETHDKLFVKRAKERAPQKTPTQKALELYV